MSNIKLGESTLNNVESLKAIDANDSTKYHIFYNEQKAILIVTAPAGSTIDILQNEIILQSYTLSQSETQHEFKVSTSSTAYTVRATLGEETTSKSILVEQAALYQIKLVYKYYLYDAGTEYVSFAFYHLWYSSSNTSGTKESNNLKVIRSGINWDTHKVGGFSTTATVDVSNYTTLKCLSKKTTSSTGNYDFDMFIRTNLYWETAWIGSPGVELAGSSQTPSSTYEEFSLSIPSGTTNVYVQIICRNGAYGSSGQYINVSSIWLE